MEKELQKAVWQQSFLTPRVTQSFKVFESGMHGKKFTNLINKFLPSSTYS